MQVVAIVQARMTSTRLPGKVLRTVLEKPLLKYQIERLCRAETIDKIVIATTKNNTDDVIEEFCRKNSILCFRGDEDDVLSRYYFAGQEYEADAVVRVTSDCPLMDPQVVDNIVNFFLQHHDKFDYVSNTLERSYPRGMDTEVFSFSALSRSFKQANQNYQREHVTPYIYQNPECFRIHNLRLEPAQDHHRWTVDTAEDFRLIRMIIEHLYPSKPNFVLADILSLLADHREWSSINAHIEQKKLI